MNPAPKQEAFWSGMLCATLMAVGSDICGKWEGFKKEYVYNVKKICVLHLETVLSQSVFLSLSLNGPT